MHADLSFNEQERIRTLKQFNILDTAPEQAFDDLTLVAAQICGTPMAAINLIDADRQWIKSGIGFELKETPREESFCVHTISQKELFVVADTFLDERFSGNPMVTGEAAVRFYAGVPLITAEGYALGALCVMDRVPRGLTEEQKKSLAALARQAMILLEMHRHSAELATAARRMSEEKRQAEQALLASEREHRVLVEKGLGLITTHDLEGRLMSVNPAAARSLGYNASEAVGRLISDFMPPGGQKFLPYYLDAIRTQKETNGDLILMAKNGEKRVWRYTNVLYEAMGETPYVLGFALDITGEKETEEALTESREIFQQFMNNSPTVSYMKDEEGKYYFLSEPAERQFNIKLAEMREKTDFEFLPHEIALNVRANDKTVLETGRMLQAIEIAPTADGQTRHWLSYKFPLTNAAGKRFVGGVSIDISELKKSEQALEENKKFIESITEHSTSIIFVFDLETMTNVYANRNVAEFLGYSKEEITALGENLLPAMIHPEDFPRLMRHFENFKTAADNQVVEFEYRAKHASGEWRWIWNREVIFKRSGTGTVRQIMGTAQDITERKRAEEKLRRNSEHLSAIIRTQNEIAVSELDLNNVMHLIVEHAQVLTEASGAVIELIEGDEMVYRAAAGDAAGHIGVRLKIDGSLSGLSVKTGEILRCDDSETDPRVDQEACRRIGVRSMLLVPLIHGGKTLGVLKVMSGRPRAFGEHPLKTLQLMAGLMSAAMGHNTEFETRKQVEIELEKARDAALESARLKSEFLANMSHEIRTPMNCVFGMTDLLLDTALSPEQRQFTETISSSAGALLTIINDILDFSKIEAGKLQFETIDFNLRNTVESLVDLFAEQAGRKNIEISANIETDVQTELRGDPGRIRQVITNLLGNAIKFTEKGSVGITVKKEKETAADTILRFEVKDTGIGIREEDQAHLFEAFTQADASTTRKFGGTGLGLAISKQIVELMYGKLSVTSAPGQGSVFSFTACFEKQRTGEPRAAASDVDLQDLRVLIVDSSPVNRKRIAGQTSAWGMIPEEAENAMVALELLRQAAASNRPFALAILDLNMPGLNGFDFARIIKSNQGLADLRIIVMTMHGQIGEAQTARAMGISGYLPKPANAADLRDCIMAVCGESAAALPEDGETPVHSQPILVTRHTLNEKRTTGRLRILVGEDNPVNQVVCKQMLSRLGYDVDIAENGLEVVESLAQKSYSCILMDCQMPELDGYAATAEIRKREKSSGTRIPIIGLTANAMEGEREKCLAIGMDDYLSKPFKKEDIKILLERWSGLEKAV